jgi:hypothetical protein
MQSGYEFTPPQPPPRPPKLTARDLLEPGEPGKRIFVPDYIEIRDLAELLGLKPLKVVAGVLSLRIFKHADEFIDFSTAAKIAQQHGFIAEKLL